MLDRFCDIHIICVYATILQTNYYHKHLSILIFFESFIEKMLIVKCTKIQESLE